MNGIGGSWATVIYDAKSGKTLYLAPPAAARNPLTYRSSILRRQDYVENRSGAASISTPAR